MSGSVRSFSCIHLFFKQKTAYEMRISDWSSDVCSSDLPPAAWQACRRPPRSRPCRERGAKRHNHRSARSLPPPSSTWFPGGRPRPAELGRASCRESVCQYVEISVVARPLKKKESEKVLWHQHNVYIQHSNYTVLT